MLKILSILVLLNVQYKTVVKIESCASSGRCRVIFDDGSVDLLLYPLIGQKVEKNGRS